MKRTKLKPHICAGGVVVAWGASHDELLALCLALATAGLMRRAISSDGALMIRSSGNDPLEPVGSGVVALRIAA